VRRRRRDGISTSVDGATGFVELHGEVDITSVVHIENAVLGLVDHPVDGIVIDFTDAEFADSKAIEALIRAARSARQAGVSVAAAGAHGSVHRAIEVCGLEHAMPIYATRGDALAATGAPTAREQ
jgi:anti-anti-sigma factor